LEKVSIGEKIMNTVLEKGEFCLFITKRKGLFFGRVLEVNSSEAKIKTTRGNIVFLDKKDFVVKK
jgi:hypothetical protein